MSPVPSQTSNWGVPTGRGRDFEKAWYEYCHRSVGSLIVLVVGNGQPYVGIDADGNVHLNSSKVRGVARLLWPVGAQQNRSKGLGGISNTVIWSSQVSSLKSGERATRPPIVPCPIDVLHHDTHARAFEDENIGRRRCVVLGLTVHHDSYNSHKLRHGPRLHPTHQLAAAGAIVFANGIDVRSLHARVEAQDAQIASLQALLDTAISALSTQPTATQSDAPTPAPSPSVALEPSLSVTPQAGQYIEVTVDGVRYGVLVR